MTEPQSGVPEPADAPAPKPAVHHRIGARLRNYLITGVLVTAPLGLTVYFAWGVIHWMDETVMPLVPMNYHPETYLPFSIPGLGLLIAIVVLILVGLLTASLLGRTFLHLSERILHRTPIVRGIYGALKQLFETVLSNQSEAFRQVVLLEYPRRGIWTVGFLTGPTVAEIQRRTEGGKVVNVFVPTTPNPTSGFLLFVPEADVIALDMSVEEGLKLVISGGIVTPQEGKGRTARGAGTSQPERA